jgi:predicted nucleotidyltransferase
MIDRFGTALEPILKGRVVAAILFGSVARQEEEPGSDVDLCCVVDDEKGKVAVQEALDANARHLFRTFGANISPILFTKRELLRKRGTSLVKAILAEGISIVGEIPREAGRG